MQQLKDAASPEFDSILASVSFKPCVFKMRISEETWNEEQRIRINVSRSGPTHQALCMLKAVMSVLLPAAWPADMQHLNCSMSGCHLQLSQCANA